MEIHTSSKSSLFLIEMILCILFFSIGASVCIHIFVTAHLQSKKSENLNYAQNMAASMVEILTGTENDTDAIYSYYPNALLEENCITVYYDEDWNACKQKNASYYLLVTLEQTTPSARGEINVYEGPERKESIFTLPFYIHTAYTI